ncbi:MAG: transporter substrate-binding domain-containing protein [Pseudomonadota bacterium]
MSRIAKKKPWPWFLGPALLALGTIIFFTSPATRTITANAEPSRKDKIRVVHPPANQPWSFLDESGRPQGILIDYWNILAQKAGLSVSFIPADQANSLRLLQKGAADVLAGSVLTSDARERTPVSLLMFKTEVSLFAAEEVRADNLAQLKGLVIGVVSGEEAVAVLKDKYPFLTLRLFAGGKDLFEAVDKGRIKAFVADQASANYNLARLGRLGRFRPLFGLFRGEIKAVVAAGQQSLLNLIKQGQGGITAVDMDAIRGRWALPAPGIHDWLLPKLLWTGAALLVLFLFSHTLLLKIRVDKRTAALAQTVTLTKFQKDRLERELARRNRLDADCLYLDGNIRPILEEVGEAMGAISLKGVVTYVNPACLAAVAYPEHEVLGRHCSEFLDVGQAAKLEKFLDMVRKGNKTLGRHLIKINTKPGPAKPMIIKTTLLENNGLPTGLFFIARECREKSP